MDCVAIHRYIISERTLIISSCSLKLLLTKHTHIYMSLPGTYFGFSVFPSFAYVEFLPQTILAQCPGDHNSQWHSGML